MRLPLLFALTLTAPAMALAQAPSVGPVQPLFASDAPIAVTLTGPFGAIKGNREDRSLRPGLLESGGERLPVSLAVRGITRRAADICDFPPVRVEFALPPAPTSVFAGQKKLKLVTHCRSNESFQQYVRLELAAYRMYNLLTPFSMRARLAQVDYHAPDGRPIIQRAGMFLEEPSAIARRTGSRRAEVGALLPMSVLRPADAARAALFEYMIGNLDFSMRAGPAGEACCHNFRLFAVPGATQFVPVPYDFDFSGMVDAPYATPPEGFRIANVRIRNYRGYCAHNAEARTAAAQFRAQQAALVGTLDGVGLTPAMRAKATAYLAKFFAEIGDEAATAKLLQHCVR